MGSTERIGLRYLRQAGKLPRAGMPVCGATSEHYRPPSACLKAIQEPARGRVRLICVISQAFRAPAIAMCVVVVLLSACSSQGASVPELTPDL